MGMSETNIWVLIRRYDRLESDGETPRSHGMQRFTLEPGLTFDDLKLAAFCWVGIEDDGSRVLKIRRHDNSLVPLSALSDGSQKNKPFIIDVVRVHQYCPAEKRTIPPGYMEALKAKLNNLERRVILAESEVPELAALRIAAVEDAASQLGNCVSFLDRRLDELAPPHWKAQIGSAV